MTIVNRRLFFTEQFVSVQNSLAFGSVEVSPANTEVLNPANADLTSRFSSRQNPYLVTTSSRTVVSRRHSTTRSFMWSWTTSVSLFEPDDGVRKNDGCAMRVDDGRNQCPFFTSGRGKRPTAIVTSPKNLHRDDGVHTRLPGVPVCDSRLGAGWQDVFHRCHYGHAPFKNHGIHWCHICACTYDCFIRYHCYDLTYTTF